MSNALNRFRHRYVVVTETQHVTKRPTFGYRSFPDRRDAMAARSGIERRNSGSRLFVRAYIVDAQQPGSVILP